MVTRQVILAFAFAGVASIGCGTNVDLGGGADGSSPHVDAAPPTCPGFASPNTAAKCIGCMDGHVSPCQANGCFNGYYCELSRLDCQPMKDACSAGAKDGGHRD